MKTPADPTPSHHGVEAIPGRRDPLPEPAADAAALSLVGLLVFCVACFAWGAAVLARRERHNLEQPGAHEAGPGTDASPPAKPAPWEREADWWKR